MKIPFARGYGDPSFLPGNTTEPTLLQTTISDLIDAIRVSDDSVVAIKSVKRSTDELSVAQFLSSQQFLRDETNHCVPIFEVLEDPIDTSASLMVMPYLRPFNNPEFRTIGEVVDFVSQTLEVCVLEFNSCSQVLTRASL